MVKQKGSLGVKSSLYLHLSGSADKPKRITEPLAWLRYYHMSSKEVRQRQQQQQQQTDKNTRIDLTSCISIIDNLIRLQLCLDKNCHGDVHGRRYFRTDKRLPVNRTPTRQGSFCQREPRLNVTPTGQEASMTSLLTLFACSVKES